MSLAPTYDTLSSGRRLALFLASLFLLSLWVPMAGGAAGSLSATPVSSAALARSSPFEMFHTAAPMQDSRLALPASGFLSPVNLSTMSPSLSNGGPVQAPTIGPSTYTDSAGTVYVTWAANHSGTWRIYFSKSTDGATFSSPVNVDPTPSTGDEDVSPTIAVLGTGPTAKVAIAYQVMVSYTTAVGGLYRYVLSSNGGSTWPGSATGNNQSPWQNIVNPVVAWSSSGDLLVGSWGCNNTSVTCSNGGDTNPIIDVFTSGTTYSTTQSLSPPIAFAGYFSPLVALACSATRASCGMSVSYENSAYTQSVLDLYHTTNEFSTSSSQHLASAAFGDTATSPWTVVMQPGDLAYGSGYNATAVYLYNVGTVSSATYIVNSTYTSNGWTGISTGPYPAGSLSVSGLSSPEVALGPSNMEAVSYVSSGGNPIATWSYSLGGAFLSSPLTISSVRSGATSIGVTAATAPFRADFVYLDSTKAATPQVYYSNFVGLSAVAAALPTTIDLGQSVNFTSTLSGGMSGYTYTWSFGGACSPSCPTTAQNPMVTYSSAGSDTVTLSVSDSIGETATASAGTITVDPDPAVAIAPLSPVVDVGQYINFSATPSNGIPPYSVFAFNLNGTVLQNSALSTFNHTFSTVGPFTVGVSVTDSHGKVSPAASAAVTVSPDPLVTSFMASPSNFTQGNSTYLNVTVGGGTSPFSYSYASLPTGCTTSNTASLLCKPTVNGTFKVTVTAVDKNGLSASHSVNFTVKPLYPSPTISAFTTSQSNFTLGGTTYLNVTAVGGTAPYTYAYTGLPKGCSSANLMSLTCTPTKNGTFMVTVVVTDMHSMTASRTVHFNVTPVIIPPLTIGSFTISPGLVGVGGTTYLNVTAAGGISPYSYAYASLPLGCYSQNTPTLSCVPNTAGTYNVTVTVTDGGSHTAIKNGTLTVKVPPTISSFIASPNPATVGSSVTLTATVSGGQSPFSYAYSGLPAGCVTANLDPLTCTPTSTGNFPVSLTVTDVNGLKGSGTTTLNVNPVSLPTVSSFTASPNPVVLGNYTTFTVTVTGGASPYTYSYAGLPTGCTTTNSYSFVCTPGGTGSFPVKVTVTDANSKSVNATVTLTVNPVPTDNLLVSSLGASVNPVSVGKTTTLTVVLSGGVAPYSYIYTGLPPGCSSSDSITLTCTPSSKGNYSVGVTVTDSKGATGSPPLLLLHVTPAIQKLAVTLTSNLTSVGVGDLFTLTGTVSGGQAPYTYVWALNGTVVSGAPSAATWSQAISHEGTYQFSLWVTDAAGSVVKSSNATVSIVTKSHNQPEAPFPWWIVAVVLVLVIVLVSVLYARKRKSGKAVARGSYSQQAGTLEGSDALGPPQSQAATAPGPMGAAASVDYALTSPTYTEPQEAAPIAQPASIGPEPVPPKPPVTNEEPLTNCPHCTGPLGPDMVCRVCGVNWVAEPKEALSPEPPQVQPEVHPPMPPPPPPLSNCPQCGGELSSDMACHTCGVSWVPDQHSPVAEPIPATETLPPQTETALPETPTEPSGEEARALTPPSGETVAEGPSEVQSEVPLSSAEPVIAEVPPEPLPSPPQPEEPTPESSAPSGTVVEPPASSSLPAVRACFICGSALEGNYCPVCDMHWDDTGMG